MDLVIVVNVHRSELQKSEGLAQMAETLLLEENRSLGTQLDQQSGQKKNWSEEEQRCSASNDIHQSLDVACSALCFVAMQKIGIKSRITLRSVLIPVLGKHMHGNADLAETLQGKAVSKCLTNATHHRAKN